MSIQQTNEKQFESDIESFFLCPPGGFTSNTDEYDPRYGVFSQTLIRFVKKTQPKMWKKLEMIGKGFPEKEFIRAFDLATQNVGILEVLRKGFKHHGCDFRVCYFRPESSLNALAAERYAQNEITCTRQWFYSKKCKNSVDMVLAVNGIPLFAFELKNPFTNQNVDNAIRQWMEDRDLREICFQFDRRILAFFAVDPTEAWMATRLQGGKTRFLPFNQGSNGAGNTGGKGNPPSEKGYPVEYLWTAVFQKDSMMDILQKFIHLKGVKPGKKLTTGTLIFPRYHQLDVVRKLIADVRENGPGKNYLIQHSAGSGKSNSIAWTAYRLASLHDDNNNPVFASVVVVTDLRVLDAQLQETISSFDHTLGSVVSIGERKTARDLLRTINEGSRIIVSTLQKFPVIYREVEKHAGRNFAIIVDEAHSSQTGISAQKLKTALADTAEALAQYAEIEGIAEDEVDRQDPIVREMLTHGDHKNLSFFAFTATPKDVTLERFGTPCPDGTYRPFHIYSMRQAIEEGFILDVLQNYMTYETCFKIAKSTPDNPDLPESRAAKAIRRFEKLHPYNISQKTAIIVETFRETTCHKINGKAKMMVVTDSRLAAVKYVREIRRYIQVHRYDNIAALVAFSGTVNTADGEVTESGLNHRKDGSTISESQTKSEFRDNFGILIVAEKYQTGFDEPLLHTMIVDKRLRGVKAVQTLSRLNRIYPGKEDTFVLDFANKAEDIVKAFQPFYQATILEGEVNTDLVYKTKQEIRRYALYSDEEVESFAEVWAKSGKQGDRDLGKLYSILQPVCGRYQQLGQDDQYQYRRKLRSFTRWYQYLAQIVRMFDVPMQKEYYFLKFLLPLLPPEKVDKVDLKGKLTLEYYKNTETFHGALKLEKEKGVFKPSTGGGGAGPQPKTPLDQIIAAINERYKGDFSDADRVMLDSLYHRLKGNLKLAVSARTSDLAIFANTTFSQVFGEEMVRCYNEQKECYESAFKSEEKYNAIMSVLSSFLYNEFRKPEETHAYSLAADECPHTLYLKNGS